MRSLFNLRRVTEATPQQVAISGGGLGSYSPDPVDGDTGFRRAGGEFRRDVPPWTREKARDHAVTAYRMNPMCRAIIDTLTSFAVGDSGVVPVCTDPEVKKVVDEFWNDPRNRLGDIQEVSMRSQLLLGEKLYELMVGPDTGAVRFAPIEPSVIKTVTLFRGNPLWPDVVVLPPNRHTDGDDERLAIVHVNDDTGLREGKAMFWAPWKALDTDTRGVPYIDAILDALDSYDQVLNNLIDRTALSRYFVVDVTVEGGQKEVDAFVASRGGTHVPPSGSMEVHNSSVTYKPFNVQSGAFEDTKTNSATLTSVAAGAGLARAQPLDAKVLTPSGWRTMGDLAVGDEVLTPDGSPSRIVGVYPQGAIDVYRVTFSDGASTRACGDHLWFTQTVQDRKHGRAGTVKTTAVVAGSLRAKRRSRWPAWNHYVPLIKPIDGADVQLPVDPYVLGVLLGNGHMRIKTDGAVEVLLSSCDKDLVEHVNELLPEGYFKYVNRYDYRYLSKQKRSLRSDLQALALVGRHSHDKFIPPAYRRASAKSRLALLQGLLDTDGTPSARTSASFTTVSPMLADQVRDLVWSLGGVCTTRSYVGTSVYRGVKRLGRVGYTLRITLPEGERYFRVDRKQSQIQPGQKTGRAVRTIRSVEPVGKVESQCIAIDHPNHLYVTDDYIVTHNTWLADPEDANRATSLTMAEPVRRRVGGVQKIWLAQQTELVRFAVDRAVAAKRLPQMVTVTDPKTGAELEIKASDTVVVTGPEIAAADAQLAAQVMLNLSTGLKQMVELGIMSQEAARFAGRKAWEDFMGVPYRAELDSPDANPDDVATAVEDAGNIPEILGRLRLA